VTWRLRPTEPGDIPVEQPTKFDLVVNLTTAKAIELKIAALLSVHVAAPAQVSNWHTATKVSAAVCPKLTCEQ
jgi:hypothetical protein